MKNEEQREKEGTQFLPDPDNFQSPEDRVDRFKKAFSMESPYVRQRLVQDLESYNILLSLEATSFEELALKEAANNRNTEYDKNDPPLPSCPHCGNIKVGRKTDKASQKENLYRCYDCKRTFSANYNSISSGAKTDLLTWTKLIMCLLRYETVSKTCKYCNISPTTYYRLRSRVYYAMQVYLQDLKLYGNIQADETYVHISYKGSNLRQSQFPEDDDRYEQIFRPRERRKRGGAYSNSSKNRNSICIFAAADDHGHVMTCYAGIGSASFNSLKKHVPADRMLATVPESDPFPFTRKGRQEPISAPGDKSLFICDGERALAKYAADVLSMESYSRVYRRKGKQVKGPKKYSHLNIQRVNYIHKRLSEHLEKCGAGSSRYIKGSLLLFDFIMNTGAPDNQAAIDALLTILSRPNLGQDEAYYRHMFEIPNHLFEWFDEENVLNKLPYTKIYSYFLYDQYRHPEEYPDITIPTLEQIADESGLTIPTVRSAYRDYTEAGYRQKIIKHFWELLPDGTKRRKKNPGKGESSASKVDAAALEIYDRYAQTRVLPASERQSLQSVCDAVNQEYHSGYNRDSVRLRFKQIVSLGLRPPLPEINAYSHLHNTYTVFDKMLEVLDAYNAIIAEMPEDENSRYINLEVQDKLQEAFPSLSKEVLLRYLQMARDYKGLPKIRAEFSSWKKPSVSDETLGAIYDEYVSFKLSGSSQKDSDFFDGIKEKYGLDIKGETIKQYLYKLIESGEKEPFPGYNPRENMSYGSKVSSKKVHGKNVTTTALKALELFEKIVVKNLAEGMPAPTKKTVYEKIKEELPVSCRTFENYIAQARAYRSVQEQGEKESK